MTENGGKQSMTASGIDYEMFAFPKKARKKDKKAMKNKKGKCEFCRKVGPTDMHHIKTRGSGGDDTEENLIELCRLCHTMVHNGHIKRQWLEAIKNGGEFNE